MSKNNIPEGWKMTTLGEAAEVKHGFAFSGNNITDAENENILLTPGNFLIGGGWKEGKKYFNGDIPNNYILAADDLIITMTDLSKEGDTLGYPALIPYNPTKKFLHNQRIGIVIINENFAIKKYIYFLMRFSGYQRFIVNTASGSTVKHTSPSKIKSYNFAMPPLLEQQAIAAVLSSLDDKIELLREQNKTLEAIAAAIFKRWFIDFEFPDKNGNPYKSSGGKMIESELGEIPKGWKIGFLGDNIISSLLKTGVDNFEREKIYLDTASIQALNIIDLKNKITFQERPLRANMQPVINSVWFAKMKNSKKALFFDTYSEWELNNFILSTSKTHFG